MTQMHITSERIEKKEKALIGSANAGQRLGRHRVDWLILGNAQRVLVANQGLRMQFERLAHELCNSVFVSIYQKKKKKR